MMKFGIVVLGEGQKGTPKISRPPGRRQAAIARAKPSGSDTCSMTWNAQTAS